MTGYAFQNRRVCINIKSFYLVYINCSYRSNIFSLTPGVAALTNAFMHPAEALSAHVFVLIAARPDYAFCLFTIAAQRHQSQ